MADASKSTVPAGPPDLNDPFLRDPLYPAVRAYVTFFRGIFRRRPLGKMRWSPDANLTGIRITSRVPVLMDREEQRPAIVVMRMAAAFAGLGLDGNAEQSLLRGTVTKADLIGSSMLIHCVGKAGETPSWLAMVVARHLKFFHQILHRWGGIQAIANRIQVGAETDPGGIVKGSGLPDVINVPVISPFHVPDIVRTGQSPDSDFQLVAQDITMAMTAELGEPRGPTKPRYDGSVVDVSRERVGDGFLSALEPPTYYGKPLVPVPPPGQPSKPLRQTTSLDP
jgi:hypothetical protein